jgi:KDO2-lipid IV(A) lauroyltransferase
VTPRGLRYAIEAAAARAAFGLLGRLPRTRAAALAGAIARTVGPRLPVSRIARRNLALAMPELGPERREAVLRGMWDNLGRVVAEYPHLAAIDTRDPRGPVEIVGAEHLRPWLDAGRPILFVSAHFGNWEIASLAAGQAGLRLHYVYRPANNRAVDRMLQGFRAATGGVYHPKGREGLRRLLDALAHGESAAMLADQKLNRGLAIPFLGMPARTGTAFAELALRHGLPIVMARVERLAGDRFRVVVEPAIEPGAAPEAIASVLTRINGTFERWIRARPDHWLWLHRRWPD